MGKVLWLGMEKLRLIPLLSLLCEKTQAINPQFQPSHPAVPIAD